MENQSDAVSNYTAATEKLASVPVKNIRELKAYSNPPEMVKTVFTPVMILMGLPTKDVWP